MRFKYLFLTSRACPAPLSLPLSPNAPSSLIEVVKGERADFVSSSRSDGVMFSIPLLLKSCSQMITEARRATKMENRRLRLVTEIFPLSAYHSAIQWRRVQALGIRLCRRYSQRTLRPRRDRDFEPIDRFRTPFPIDIPEWWVQLEATDCSPAWSKQVPSKSFRCTDSGRRMQAMHVLQLSPQLTGRPTWRFVLSYRQCNRIEEMPLRRWSR